MELTIRRALATDALFLTSISFGAKRYWNYPEEYFEVWHDELTITEDYIEQNIVYVAQKKDTIIGYFSIVEVNQEHWNGEVFISQGYWLDHIYIRPAYIRSGIGTELMEYAQEYCRENGIEKLYIFSDPFANGFYEKLGATYIKESPSSIENRTVSLYEYRIPEKSKEQIEEEELLQKIQEEAERLRQEAEEAERLRQEAEEAERLRQEAEEAERLRQEAEEAERLRQEAEEAERLRQEAEEAERLRQEAEEAEEAERLRQEAEEAERLRQEAEEAERLRQEAEETERLRQEAEEAERLRQEAEEAERLRQEAEETERLIQEAEKAREILQEEDAKQKRKSIFGIPIEKIKHRPIKLEHESLEQKISELDQEFEDDFEDIEEVAEEATLYEIDESEEYDEDHEEYSDDEDDEDYSDDEDHEEYSNDEDDEDYSDYEDDEEYAEDELIEDDREIQIPKLQLDEAEIAALIRPVKDDASEEEKILENIGTASTEIEVHIKTEKEKMLAGELYIAWGDEFANDKRRARRLLREFNNTDVEDKKSTIKILKELFGSTGEYIHIEPNFRCDYGYNIHIGDNFYAGYECVILDSCQVKIGDNCILSPQVGIYTSAYPLNPEKRSIGYEYAKPITIGNNVWIGGGSIINPGVTIGDNVVVVPGSVVLADVPDNVLIGGNPAKVIKEIETEK
ncbi:GNAT family N-acetyltransferase [Cellulosilyticum sp. ST5]|uniref:GNAT family N-acetyltransferase n=1 Tax=Cellulosilyticum sp. ST5 TaxID=3055805 RepID=UPI0039773438